MRVYVSLTSTCTRLKLLKHTLLSLNEQSVKPDKIYVCLSQQPYLLDEGVETVPDWLAEMELSGLIEVLWVENIGSYRRLLPVYNLARNDDIIVTCDDDVIYDAFWLETLLNCASFHKDKIVCGRARVPVRNIFGKYQSYVNWKTAEPGSCGLSLVPTGVSGVLYRKCLLSERTIKDREFIKIAPKQDDLWFKLSSSIRKVEVIIAPETEKYVYPIGSPSSLSLDNVNIEMPKWDRFFIALTKRFLVKLKAYLEYWMCGNDDAIRRIENYKLKSNQP